MTFPVMIMGWIRWSVILFFILTIIYFVLTFTKRAKQKDRLRSKYSQIETELSEREFVDQGMARYNKTLGAKLLLGVYLFPLAVFGILIYFAHLEG